MMQRVSQSKNGHQPQSVLIVNDEPEQLLLMDSLLRKAGYSVFTAEDGKQGFEVAKLKRPDLVISDVSMPDVDGIEFCRLIREDRELNATPILLVTAHQKDTASVIAGFHSGADDYLELPVDSARLVAKVSRLVERTRMESRIRESEERYRLLFESTPQPIWVYDTETLCFLAVNQAAVDTYGYSREEFLSMTTNDIRSSEEIPALLIKTATGADEPVISSPWRHRRKDGTSIYVEMTSHVLNFKGHNATLVIASDVTERKILDEKQQKMHATLQHSAMEWRQTFNAIDFPVLIVDLEGRVRRLNLAAEEIVGIESEAAIGRHVLELGHGEPWRKAADLIQAIQNQSSSTSAEVRDPVNNKTWAITLYLIQEFGSVGERAILIAQDISARTELEASLRQSEMMSLLGSLVAGVAHEVRNPLFGISSILDAFETRFTDRKDYLRYTNVLRDEVGRLTVLMEELLEYGKPFRGEFYPAPLPEVVTKCMRACMPAAELARVQLINEMPEDLPPLMVDRRRLSKVFVNLIENGIQHSNAGGTVSVVARVFEEGQQNWLDCSIKDNGTGIQAEDMPLIFEPFFSRRRGGTGLGLAIAQRIMTEHGGKLLAANNPTGGACMTARFPLRMPEAVNG
jgi:PAS domain S-box-containing protein